MLDIQKIRQTPDEVAAALKKRGYEVDFSEFLALDAKRKEIIGEAESLKAERNSVSREIPKIKKEGGDASELLAKMKTVSDTIKKLDEEQKSVESEIHDFIAGLPNTPDEDVVSGGKDKNEVVSVFGKLPEFDFEFKDHVELATSLNLIDYERGRKTRRQRFLAIHRSGRQKSNGRCLITL